MRNHCLAAFILFCLLSSGLFVSCNKAITNNLPPIFKQTTAKDSSVQKMYYVTTLAGTGQAGYVDGPDSIAQFNFPWTIAVDNQGNIYVGDQGNFAIRKISPCGLVSTFASINSQRPVYNTFGLTTDRQGNVYMPEAYVMVRKMTPEGVSSVLAGGDSIGYRDGPGSTALFHLLFHLAADRAGNLYLPDFDMDNRFRLRKVSPAGVVSTVTLQDSTGISWDGAPGAWNTWAIAIDPSDNIYISGGSMRSVVKKITPQGIVSLFAGQENSGRFFDIRGLAADGAGNVYVAEGGNDDIYKVAHDGTVSIIAGLPGYAAFSDGQGYGAWFNDPMGIAADRRGVLYVADVNNNRIRKIEYK